MEVKRKHGCHFDHARRFQLRATVILLCLCLYNFGMSCFSVLAEQEQDLKSFTKVNMDVYVMYLSPPVFLPRWCALLPYVKKSSWGNFHSTRKRIFLIITKEYTINRGIALFLLIWNKRASAEMRQSRYGTQCLDSKSSRHTQLVYLHTGFDCEDLYSPHQ